VGLQKVNFLKFKRKMGELSQMAYYPPEELVISRIHPSNQLFLQKTKGVFFTENIIFLGEKSFTSKLKERKNAH
jgi:hypothetical protein